MKRIYGICALLAALFIYTSTASAQNDQEVAFGGYVVNFNTFPSTFLDQNIANAAGVNRTDGLGVIILAVRKEAKEGKDISVKALVTVTATNLIGQIFKVRLGEVVDGDAIYYIGDFPTTFDQTISFNVFVQPEGGSQKKAFKFSRRF